MRSTHEKNILNCLSLMETVLTIPVQLFLVLVSSYIMFPIFFSAFCGEIWHHTNCSQIYYYYVQAEIPHICQHCHTIAIRTCNLPFLQYCFAKYHNGERLMSFLTLGQFVPYLNLTTSYCIQCKGGYILQQQLRLTV